MATSISADKDKKRAKRLFSRIQEDMQDLEELLGNSIFGDSDTSSSMGGGKSGLKMASQKSGEESGTAVADDEEEEEGTDAEDDSDDNEEEPGDDEESASLTPSQTSQKNPNTNGQGRVTDPAHDKRLKGNQGQGQPGKTTKPKPAGMEA